MYVPDRLRFSRAGVVLSEYLDRPASHPGNAVSIVPMGALAPSRRGDPLWSPGRRRGLRRLARLAAP